MRHAYLGVSTSDRGHRHPGALIQSVTSSGPAASAGLRAGDVVTRIGSAAIKGTNDLVAAIAVRAPAIGSR